jgi:hypothetical protein
MHCLRVKCILMFCVGIFFLSANTYGLPIEDPGTAKKENVTLTHIFGFDFDTPDNPTLNSTNLLSVPYTATSAIGVFDQAAGLHNDDGGLSNPQNGNIGLEGDGLLNGQYGYFTGLEFIDESDLQDIDGDGDATDPGWIHLASVDTESPDDVQYSTAGPNPYLDDDHEDYGFSIDIEDILTFTFTWNGPDDDPYSSATWVLKTNPAGWEDVLKLLGPATFDHLAFSLKASNGFAVYDFNFKDIFEAENNPQLNFQSSYVFKGTLNTDDFESKDISHINVWARDPADNAVVPEPATMALVGIGLIALAGIGRKRHRTN